MARAFWKGSISFGLVEIPVTLRPATQSDELSFTLLDRADFAPVGNKRYNKTTGREVPWERVVRGYEYEPDEYVVLTDEEIEHANAHVSGTIEIEEFVDASEIDPAFFDAPYYVEPQKRGSKSYALMHEALQRTGKVGIARVVLRTRQRLAALTARGPVLVLNLLRYSHELRGADEVDVPTKGRKGSASDREVQMAERLIGEMTGRWDPSRYKDEYRDEILALVRRKVKAGQTQVIVEPEGRRPAAKEVVDLMPLLKESLAARGRKEAPAPAGPKRARPASRPHARGAGRRQKRTA